MLVPFLALLAQTQTVIPRPAPQDLPGPWLLRTGDSAAWADPQVSAAGWDTVTVPGSWNGRVAEDYRGFAWYRLRVTFPRAPAQPMGLWLRSVATAYEVYIDGELVGAVGGFPPEYRPRTVIPQVVAFPPAANREGPHTIAVRVYSGEKVGGLVGRVQLGSLQALQRDAFRPDLYLISAAVLLVGIGLMQVFFWLRRPLASEHAAIFAVCACLAVFFICWMPTVRLFLEPRVYWYRLYLAAASASAAAYCYALRRLFSLDRGDRLVMALSIAYLVLVPVFLGLPAWNQLQMVAQMVLNPLLLAGALISMVIAVMQLRQGARHARLLLWGTILLACALFYDIITDYGLLSVQPSFPWFTLIGAVGFVASLSLTTAEKFVESETLALYDRLTGLYRREVVMDALTREIRRSSRTGVPLAVIMLDVDRFKQVNDTLGHQAGDRVLAEVGRRMGEAGRAVDWLGRYGGEEFIAVLSGADIAGARLGAERLRKAVAALPIVTGRTARTITLSAGIAVYAGGTPDEWPTTEQLVGAADAALYRAKNSGRDTVSE